MVKYNKGKGKSVKWCRIAKVNTDTHLANVKVFLLKKIEEWRKLDYGLYMGERFNISTYIAAINLLESKNLYSRNIADIEGIRATIKKVAKIDRLPDDNSNEGMQIIQMA